MKGYLYSRILRNAFICIIFIYTCITQTFLNSICNIPLITFVFHRIKASVIYYKELSGLLCKMYLLKYIILSFINTST